MELKIAKTVEEAIKAEYLQDKKVILKPSPRHGKMVAKPGHIAYFQIEGGSTSFCLPRNKRGDLSKVFKNDNEREFFENNLGLDLNTAKKGNFFESFFVRIIKDENLMINGEEFDLSDPMDNLRYRVLKLNTSVAPSWEQRKDRTEYRWALIDKESIEKAESVEFDSQEEFWEYVIKIKGDDPKIRKVLNIYFSTIGVATKVPRDASKSVISGYINEIAKDAHKRTRFLAIATSDLFKHKVFILEAIEVNAVKKEGKDVYIFTGEDRTYTFEEMAKVVESMSEEQDDLYMKIQSQINGKK